MSLVIGLLTFVLVVTCLLLMLLVLIQLPKKEAGAGSLLVVERRTRCLAPGRGTR